MATNITTKAISNIKKDPKQLERFIAFDTQHESFEEFASVFAGRVFTLVNITKDESKYEKFKYVTSQTNADVAGLCIRLGKAFDNHELKVNPILDLYEALLRENWTVIKRDRDNLNAVDAYNMTSTSNVAICEAIAAFLKEVIVEYTKSNTSGRTC